MDGLPKDNGAFAWRGFMIDVCRHFWPIEVLHRLIDGMSLVKLNILHLHLSDDQGWRFESKKWPKLTDIGAWRNETIVGRPARYVDHESYPESYKDKYDGQRHGGFYTQDQLRELVKYAKSKGVIVEPEIDMPGHMRAARAAYPELGYNNRPTDVGRSWGIYPEVLRVDEAGISFCKDILDEICDVFDSAFINIGGDECPKMEWEDSEKAKKQLKDIGGKDMDELQTWFSGEMARHLASKGRRVAGWDEIIDGGVPAGKPVIIAWRGWTDAAKRATDLGVETVQAPAPKLYLDYAQGPEEKEPLSIGPGSDLETVYAFDPYGGIADKNRHLIKGMQANLWVEYIADVDHLWYMIFPRLIALADVAYLGEKRPSFEEFKKGLPARLEELKKLGIGHHPLD